MKQRTALFVAAGLTAFVLVVVGGVAGAVAGASAASPTATVDPALQAQIQQRESAYQGLIQEANAQLQQAYQQLDQLQSSSQPAQSPATTYPVSPDLAAALAVRLAPGSKLTSWPTLVDFQGTVAYEIVLDRGTVYIDATTGHLLYNGASQTVNASLTAGTGSEHEGNESDD
jgi:uncharacterized membrane protein YkoI